MSPREEAPTKSALRFAGSLGFLAVSSVTANATLTASATVRPAGRLQAQSMVPKHEGMQSSRR